MDAADFDGAGGDIMTLEECATLIGEQAERIAQLENAQRWIPVREALPKPGEWVEFYSPAFGHACNRFHHDVWSDSVTHWRPTQPPAQQGETG